jgi:hypothetical protein
MVRLLSRFETQLTFFPQIHGGPIGSIVIPLGTDGHDPFVCDGPNGFYTKHHGESDLQSGMTGGSSGQPESVSL